MRKEIAIFVYKIAKYFGAFWLCKKVVSRRQGLRILCYHGLWISEAQHFGDALFMSIEKFDQRMKLLKRLGYSAISLQSAVNLQDNCCLPPDLVVITIDDGFFSTWLKMLPVLEKEGLVATVYIPTYFVKHQVPIYPLMLRYIVESAGNDTHINTVLNLKSATTHVACQSTSVYELLLEKMRKMSLKHQGDFCKEIAEKLSIDLRTVLDSRQFELMQESEIQDTVDRGFDIQLHTHRHRVSHDGVSTITLEIQENRQYLEPIVGKRLADFCYPSGVYDKADFSSLLAAGVKSATTCLSGINYLSTNRLELKRFLDAESVSDIEFEAELSGFCDLLRKIRKSI